MNKIKYFSITSVILIITFMISGCSVNKSNLKENQHITQIKSESTVKDDESEIEVIVPETESDVTATEFIIENSVGQRITNIKDAFDFSEGKSWVYSDYQNEERWFCIDLDGIIIFMLEKGNAPITGFVNGVALTSRSTLVDDKGSILASPELTGYDSISTDKCTVNGTIVQEKYEDYYKYFNGCFTVKKSTDTFSGTGTQYGLVGSNGAWLFELTEAFVECIPVGNNVFQIGFPTDRPSIIGHHYFNATSRQLFKIDQKSTFRELGTYNDEVMLLKSEPESLNTILVVDTLGETITSIPRTSNYHQQEYTKNSYQNDFYGAYSSGLFYYDKIFYDISGTPKLSLLDLEVYYKDSYSYLPEFEGDYALIGLYNPQGRVFYTSIDKNGEFQFEPIKVKEIGPISDGMIRYLGEDNKVYYISADGKMNFNVPGQYEDCHDFHEGAALVQKDNYCMFYDKLGSDFLFYEGD